MTDGSELSYIVAFTAGILTFFSPCFLPLVPAYLVYLTGLSFEDLKRADTPRAVRARMMLHSLFFILGFSVVFMALGLTATFLGKFLYAYQRYLRIAGGALIIIFGLVLMGVIRFDFLLKERKFHLARQGVGYASSFLVGVTFAAAWTPCVGAILGSILVLASQKKDLATGASFLAVYSLGIAVPFFVSTILANWFILYLKKAQKAIAVMTYVSGIFLIALGLAIMTDFFQVVTHFVTMKLTPIAG